MTQLRGKVALITGAARGQGRAHAVRFAQEGCHVILTDLPASQGVDAVTYEMPPADALDETAAMAAKEGVRAVIHRADVRDLSALEAAVADGVSELGRLDIVVANAGITPVAGLSWEISAQQWRDTIDINLTGVWHTLRAAIPAMIAAGNGGSIIGISSTAGIHAYPYLSHYSAAKHALVGLIRSVAQEVAPYRIRANTVHPGAVDTPMMMNEATYKMMRPDLENPTRNDMAVSTTQLMLLPVPWVESDDVTNAVLWLASDASRYVTGITLPVDAGTLIK